MKEMLINGGASGNNYGNAIKIYSNCFESSDEGDKRFARVNAKIALACALEFATPIKEFDTSKDIDAVARFKQFAKAHKNGDLDPAFPHLSIWEMRHVVGCIAPDKQMKWCRKMVFNYAPHLTCITDPKLKYTYILDSDVRMRQPVWTGSPKTFPMILAGGGNTSLKSLFGRFLLQSFGIPVWGCICGTEEGFTRWTSDGWIAQNGAEWKTAEWKGRSGNDFKAESEARSLLSNNDYFKKIVLRRCLSDILERTSKAIPTVESYTLHPDRCLRSLSLLVGECELSKASSSSISFAREGKPLVETKCEKYLDAYQLDEEDVPSSVDSKTGVVTIPASQNNQFAGNIIEIESFEGGKQLNFMADGGAEYKVPDEASSQKYLFQCDVCTVSDQQSSLFAQADSGGTIEIEIPYTLGEWKRTDGVEISLNGGESMRLARPANSLGVAIRRIVLTPK